MYSIVLYLTKMTMTTMSTMMSSVSFKLGRNPPFYLGHIDLCTWALCFFDSVSDDFEVGARFVRC